ncbi:MAG: SMP-30/gluconolactonase/LRE family protein [Ignavibacteriaceae bacterium]
MKLLLLLCFVSSLIYSQNNISSEKNNFIKIADSLNFPEGPAWDGKENLYVSSCYGGFITKINDEKVSTFIDSTQKPFRLKQTNGLTFDKHGNIFACDYGIGAILKITPERETSIYAEGFEGKKFNRPNDLAFDSSGNLYFTDLKSYGKDKPDGRVFRIDNLTKKITIAAENLCFPNGIAFSIDGKKLFVCESAQNRILSFDVDKKGLLKNKKIFIELEGGDPDGIAFDKQGNLYAAHFGSGQIFIISSEGKIINTLIAPGKKPSNVEFGGSDLKTLFITEDETNSVYKLEVDVPGFPLFYSPIMNE